MKKRIAGAVLLAAMFIGIIGAGIWSLSFVDTPDTNGTTDIAAPFEAQASDDKTEAGAEPSQTDSSEQDDFFGEYSVLPPVLVEEKKVTWVFSEVASFFIEEQGADPAYIVNWIFETAERHGYELIIDVDPDVYLQE